MDYSHYRNKSLGREAFPVSFSLSRDDPVNFLDPFGLQLMEWDNLGRTFRETGEYLVSDEAVTAYKQTGVSVCAVIGGALLTSGGSAVATARYAELLRKTDHVAVTGIKQIGVRYGNTAENALSKVYYGPFYKLLNSPPNRPLSEAQSELKKKIKSFTDKQRNK